MFAGSQKKRLPGDWREVLAVAYPLIISMASFTVMQFADRIFLARWSSLAIQAAMPAGLLAFTLICLFQGVAAYSSTFVAQYHGAGDPRGCVRAAAQGMWLSVLAWPLMVAMTPLGWLAMRLSGHAPELIAAEREYFDVLMLGSVLVTFGSAVGGYFTGRGRMRLNTVANVIGCAVNVVLDYVMIFGKLGFPAMGIAGAAWATVIASCVAPVIQFVWLLRDSEVRRGGLRRTLAFDGRQVRQLLRYGLPSALHTLVDAGAFACFLMLTGRLEPLELAASNIGFSINGVAFMPLLGISMAAAIVVGQYQGCRNGAAAERAGWSALKIGWAYMLVVSLSFVAFPEGYYTLFHSQDADYTVAELVAVGRVMMLLMAAWGMVDTMNIILAGALKGAGDTRYVMVYMLVMGWALWIPGEVLILRRGYGILAAWAWLTVYILVLSIGFLLRWKRGRWKAHDLIGSAALPPPASQHASPLP